MPPTATLEDIKAHQRRIEKNKITPDGLPPCPRCFLDSAYFKAHAYRERRFLIIIDMFVQAVYCSFVRSRCPGCGKTFTDYPAFAIPHKHYTQQSITGFSASYLDADDMTYQLTVMVGGGGAKMRPVGVLVFTKDGVKVESIPDRAGIIDKVFGKIPDLIDLAKKHSQ